jgi:hypothetical protein
LLKFSPVSAAFGPDHPGIAPDNFASFSVENCQLEALSDIKAVILIAPEENATQANIFNDSWEDLTLNCVFYIQGAQLSGMFTGLDSSFDRSIQRIGFQKTNPITIVERGFLQRLSPFYYGVVALINIGIRRVGGIGYSEKSL